ncbi:thiamine phosphate synthase [Flavobacteriaceae bacterium Ap0902]|nr:thiamine phosphate synthase [Flavobacteriaceae bacterium Ap0902]
MSLIDYSLMYVTDERIIDENAFFQIIEDSLQGGATIIQLREKSMPGRELYHRAWKVKKLCDSYNVPLIINDRLDIALAIDAQGLHVGQEDLPATVARRILGSNKIIGLSISNAMQLNEANQLPIDYVGLSPIFQTSTKTKNLDKPAGLEGLKNLSRLSKFPMISIGGINENNTAAIMEHGSAGIAVVSAISQAKNPIKATEKLKYIICKTGTNI